MMETKWSKILIHASAFFMPVLIPILFFIISQDKEIKKLSLQALLFQFVMWVLIGVSAFLSWILIGLPFLIVFAAMTVIVPVIGIVKALSDAPWEYPIVKHIL